jgi:hypothetical protein
MQLKQYWEFDDNQPAFVELNQMQVMLNMNHLIVEFLIILNEVVYHHLHLKLLLMRDDLVLII